LPGVTNYKFSTREVAASKLVSTWATELKQVQDYKTLRIYNFHTIGDSGYGNVPVSQFQQIVDLIKDYNIDLITWSDLWDKYIVPMPF
jgi:hypothetical protein